MFRILAFLFIFSVSFVTLANPSYEVFKDELHPQLIKRCFDCHGIDQAPYHSQFDPEDSYTQALRTINMNFPEESVLWKRSFNGHCGKPKLCGFRDQKFLTAISNWIDAEKENISLEDNQMALVATAVITDESLATNKILFRLENGVEFYFDIKDLGGGVLVFDNPSLSNVVNNFRFQGIELRSPDVDFRYQNLNNQSWVIKGEINSTKKARLVNYNNQASSYLMGSIIKPEQPIWTVELWLTSPVFGESTEELLNFKKDGYNASVDQAYFPPVTSINLLSNGPCASFASGELKCWSKNRMVSAITSTVGVTKVGMQSIKSLFKLPKEEMGISISIVDKTMYWSRAVEFFITGAGHVYYGLHRDLRKTETEYYFNLKQVLPFQNIVEHMKILGSHCFRNRSNTIYCLQKEYRGKLFPEHFKGDNNLPLYEEFDFSTDPLVRVVNGPQERKAGGRGNNFAFFKSGGIKLINANLPDSNDKTLLQTIGETEYNDVFENRTPIDVQAFWRTNGYLGHGVFFLFEDRLTTYYPFLYRLPKNKKGGAAGGFSEPIEEKIQRLKSTPSILFPPGDKAIKLVQGDEMTCVLFQSKRIQCYGSTNYVSFGFTPNFLTVDLRKSPYWEGDQSFPESFVDFGENTNQIDDIFGFDHPYSDVYCVKFSGERGNSCFGRTSSSFLGKSTPDNPSLLKNENGSIPVVFHFDIDPKVKLVEKYRLREGYCLGFNNGRIKCFGSNEYALLGLGDTSDHEGESPLERDYFLLQSPQFMEGGD